MYRALDRRLDLDMDLTRDMIAQQEMYVQLSLKKMEHYANLARLQKTVSNRLTERLSLLDKQGYNFDVKREADIDILDENVAKLIKDTMELLAEKELDVLPVLIQVEAVNALINMMALCLNEIQPSSNLTKTCSQELAELGRFYHDNI
jgi:hypothetical protein